MLVACPQCRGQVWAQAPSCPHCGYFPPRPAPSQFLSPKANASSCITVVAVLVMVPILLFVFGLILAAIKH